MKDVKKFVKNHPIIQSMKGWDRIRKTSECPHCNGTKKAPSADGRTECGFCEERPDSRDP